MNVFGRTLRHDLLNIYNQNLRLTDAVAYNIIIFNRQFQVYKWRKEIIS